MKIKSFRLVVFTALLSAFLSCASTKSSSYSVPKNAYHDPEIIYYGANITQFPPEVREWIMYSAFTKEKMEGPFMLNPKLRVWWSDDNNAVLAEASYIIAKGYVGAGTLETWGQGSCYYGSSDIFYTYGQYAKYQTLRFKWELKQEAERLLRNDPAYAEVIAFSKKLCAELEYDWANFSGYKGVPVKRTPNKRYAVCEGYANEVMDKILQLKCVQTVQMWSLPGVHAWNVLKLVDGRTLYYDLTWFDNEHIDEKTGRIYQTDDYDWANITFNKDLFYYSNIGYGTRTFIHALGKFDREKEK